MRRKILFITPFGKRTGSEMLLWYLLQNLDYSKFEVRLLCLEKGDMLKELPAEVKWYVSDKRNKSFLSLVRKVFYKSIGIAPVDPQIRRIHKHFKPDFWFANTIITPDVIKAATRVDVKLVTFSHESFLAFNHLKAAEFNRLIARTNTFIGCSKSVCKNLEQMGHQDVRLQYGFIDPASITITASRVNELKQRYQIQDGEYIWVISGHTGYFKGVDSLPELVSILKNEKYRIFWLGSTEHRGIHAYIEKYLELHFPGRVTFTGALKGDDYYNHFAMANALLMLSKEESFSLVALEAVYLGKPILSFSSGGITELIEDGMGKVVDSWNVKDLAAEMINFMHGGVTISAEVQLKQARRFSVEHQLPKFQKLLSEL